MSNDERIKVVFPDKMEVTSPEIDSIKHTAEQISNWLHNDFREVIKPLQVLTELEEMLTHFKKEMVEQFGMLFTSQIESQVVSRQASMKANEQKIKLIEDQIAKKEVQFREAKERIIARYEKIAEQLVGEHSKYLRQLDSHAYEITDQIYPNQIQESFSYTAIPSHNYLTAHVVESALARSAALNAAYNKAKDNMTEFLAKREAFSKLIEPGVTDQVPSGEYFLPVWFVEQEDIETGEKRVDLYFDWEINDQPSPISTEQLETLETIALRMVGNAPKSAITDNDKFSVVKKLREDFGTPETELARFLKDAPQVRFAE